MKIALVGTDLGALDNSVGALEKLCIGWATGLEKLGADIRLFSIDSPGLEFKTDLEVTNFRSIADLTSKIRDYNPDLVITNNRPLWDLSGKHGKINIFHNYPDAWGISNSFCNEVVKTSLQKSKNLAVSQTLARHIENAYAGTSIGILYPFIDNIFMRSAVSENRTAHTPLRVLFPNRTLEKKGLRWTIEAIDRHLTDLVTLTLVKNISPWSTETQEHRSLLELAKSRSYVNVVEKSLTYESLINLYRSHDVVITPSVREEGLGLIPIEAQALGIPVVSTNLGGLPESTFAPNLIIDAYDHLGLATAILEVSAIDTQSRNQIKQKISDLFSYDSSISNLASTIESLLNGNSFG